MSRSVLQRPSHRFRKPPRRRLVDSLQTALLSAAALVLLPSASSAASPPEPVPVARFSSVARAGPLPQPALSPTSRMQSGADASVEDRGRQLRLRPGSLDGGTSSRSRGDFVSLSGNKVSTGMTLYYLYPGACTQRYLGTWSPQSNRTWDDLNSYAIGTPGPYNVADESLDETLWHAYDASMTPADQRPSALDGNRSIWCGKYDPNWVRHVGYPNRTYQILYIDTGAHAADYVLTFIHRFGVEKNGDFIYLIGGGGGATDPIGNSRNSLDAV
ncbi:MAG TPA: hypothetical protein VF363_06920, partial [Candidatus Eisenbacteria bacterium]